MKHRTNKLSLLVSAIAICFALIFSGTPITMLAQIPSRTVTVQSQAATKATPTDRRVPALTKQDIQARINRDGRLPAAYRSLILAQQSKLKNLPARLFAAGSASGNTGTPLGVQSQSNTSDFIWDRKDDEVLFDAVVNAADPAGISIQGVKSGDIVEIEDLSGVASFADDEGNKVAQSIIAVIGVGADGVAEYYQHPEAVKIIDQLTTIAKDQFNATGAKEKFRDGYGADPSDGGKAQAEGGIIVCLPGSGGAYYSGSPDHQERWIKKDGTRDFAHMPAHIKPGTAFFPLRFDATHNRQTITSDGQIIVLAWDDGNAFGDNAGFYRVHIHLKKGAGPVDPGPILKTQGGVGGGKVTNRRTVKQ